MLNASLDSGFKIDSSSPVVIGGVGGSGTRVVATILKELGFYIGSALSRPQVDNLWFSDLFLDAAWFRRCAQNNDTAIFERLKIFESMMLCRFKTRSEMLSALLRRIFFERKYVYSLRIPLRSLWTLRSFLFSSVQFPHYYIGWGWKEPNTHVYLEYLIKYFAEMKYIHVIRNGLDMAFSKNQYQFNRWRDLYNVPAPARPELLPKALLNYWIKANDKAIKLGKKQLGDRFMELKYDKLCSNPGHEIKQLICFLEIDYHNVNLDKLCAFVKTPGTTGRYKKRDMSFFSKNELDAVKQLGFEVGEK